MDAGRIIFSFAPRMIMKRKNVATFIVQAGAYMQEFVLEG